MNHKNIPISIISVGPGNKKYLTLQALDKIHSVELLAGAKRLKDFAGKKQYVVLKDLVNDAFEVIEQNKNRPIGILVSGDAGFFSLASRLVERFGKNNIEIIPGVSILQASFAVIKEAWPNTTTLSFHGKNYISFDFNTYKNQKILLLIDNIDALKEFFNNNAFLLKEYSIHIFQNFSLEDELTININGLKDLEHLTEGKLTTVLMIPQRI
jgi:cobalt-precorrin-7 (C5)-methyltransferase